MNTQYISQFATLLSLLFCTSCINPGGITGADMNPTGTPTENSVRMLDNIFFQEFWSNGQLFYLVTNLSSQIANLKFIQNNQTIATLNLLTPFSVSTLNLQQFSSLDMIEVYKNENNIGLLIPPSEPTFQSSALITLASSLNALERTGTYWQLESNTERFIENRTYTIELKIDPNFTIFALRRNQGLPQMDQFFKMLEITQAQSSNLKITESAFGFIFEKSTRLNPEPPFYTATLTIKTKAVNDHREMLMYLNGQSCDATMCFANSLTTAFLVVPESE